MSNRDKGYPCTVIQDLMPLFLDGEANPDTIHVVEKHLSECTSCREYLKTMRGDIIKGIKRENVESLDYYKVARRMKYRKIKWLFFSIILFLILMGVTFSAFHQVIIEGNSMEPTIESGDRLFVNKLIYLIKNPVRLDIIVYHGPDKRVYIKRIVGLPGETIEIREGLLYINGNKYEDLPIKDLIYPGMAQEEPLQLGEDDYFVLGDNYQNSKDSRNRKHGLINRKQIIGRVYLPS